MERSLLISKAVQIGIMLLVGSAMYFRFKIGLLPQG